MQAAFAEIGDAAASTVQAQAPHPLMHRTESVDYGFVLQGEITRLANANWDGRNTSAMKFDQRKWAEWFTNEFMPYREKVAAGLIPERTPEPRK